MSEAVLVRGARQLLTLRGSAGPRRGADLRNLSIIQDGAVLIVDGVIREVGPSRRIENLAESRKALEINASGRVVMPGFVDSHTYLVSGPPRLLDYEMLLAGATHREVELAGGGFPGIFKTMQNVPVRTLETQAWRVAQELIRQGTTTVEAKSGYGVTETAELRILRAQAALNEQLNFVVSTFAAARQLPSEGPGDADAYTDWMVHEMLARVRHRKMAEFFDASYEQDGLPLPLTRRLLERAAELGFGVKIQCGQQGNAGGVALAVELNAVSVAHAVYLDNTDIALLARSGVIATLLPGPVFFDGGKRYASARAMIDRGVAVALATGYNPETCPTHNMQTILALACLRMKMSAAEAISAVTINAAHAVRRAGMLGSLECGKLGDLLVLRISDYRELPYNFGVNLVDMTMKGGKVICQVPEVKCPSG